MIQDTVPNPLKALREPEAIVTSLIALRDELLARYLVGGPASEALLKINSCLYSGYPRKAE